MPLLASKGGGAAEVDGVSSPISGGGEVDEDDADGLLIEPNKRRIEGELDRCDVLAGLSAGSYIIWGVVVPWIPPFLDFLTDKEATHGHKLAPISHSRYEMT